jgi:hypothetical protein
VETACDGIELAVQARNRERAQAWLERLFGLQEFEIERSKQALAAWHEAGWGATLWALQETQVARGGGPVGVVLDWLERHAARSPLGFWGTFFKARRLLAAAPGPCLRYGLLRWLPAHDASLCLRWLLSEQTEALRRDDTAWGEASYALSSLEEHDAVLKLLSDWRQRERPPSYAMANLAIALAVRRRWDELAEVVQATLARLPYQEDQRMWQLLVLARAGDLEGLRDALGRVHEWTPEPWMGGPLEALQAFLTLAQTRAAGGSVLALRRLCQPHPAQAGRALQGELLRLARNRHTPWTRLGLWLLPV